MATLVTGGTGFVGSNVVRSLAQRGHHVLCFDVAEADELMRKFVEPWAGLVTFIQGDVVNVGELERVAAQHTIDKIVHAAATTPGQEAVERERSRLVMDINIAGTANVLDLACGLDLERFLFVSSVTVYGLGHDPHELIREDATINPFSLYDISKYAGEVLTRRYGELHGFQTVSVRVGTPYGPMERDTWHRFSMGPPQVWTGNVVRGEPIRVGDRSLGRDFTYVADTADGIATILDAPTLSHDVYNLSPGCYTTVGEIIEVLRALRPGLQVVDDPSSIFGAFGQKTVQGLMDETRLREDLGFTSNYDLTDGLKEFLEWREAASFLD